MSRSDFLPASPDILARNLRALGPAAADVAAQIRAATPEPGALELVAGRRGGVGGRWQGQSMASSVDPEGEAARLADRIDVMDTATVFVHGFGFGGHVAELARRMRRTGAIIVLEPDVELLHAVLSSIDLAADLAASNIVIVTDPDNRVGMGEHQGGITWLLAQGTAFLDHPPSRARLGDAPVRFSRVMTDVATHARLTVTTAMLRGVTTMENLVANLPRYATGPGIDGWRDVQAGRPAIIVSAGPSLPSTLDRLADPAVRERAVIIAVQTVLKPMLERGIRPHFVTALDYHPVSRQYYEGLRPEDVEGITLVIDPKAHPGIADAYPGRVHCCASTVLDRILGDVVRPMGTLPAGSTVAHLCAYLGRYLGCDPLILVGQDLGFTDAMYYGPGAAVHRTWAPELGPFNSVASMEWQRIARHRGHVVPVDAVGGGTVLSDAQMISYRQQFERDFAADVEAGRTVINTAGGARIANTESLPFDEALERHLGPPLAAWPEPDPAGPPAGRRSIGAAIGAAARDVAALVDASKRSRELLGEMIERQADTEWMAGAFTRLYAERDRVGARLDALALVDHLNQVGVFKRLRSDRRITLTAEADATTRQRAELDRDLVNVEWIGDAARELLAMLEHARDVLRRPDGARPERPGSASGHAGPAATIAADGTPPRVRVGAVIPLDAAEASHAFGPAAAPPLPPSDAPCRLRATLDRLDRCRELDEIVLLVESGVDLPPAVRDWLTGEREPGAPATTVVRVDAPPIGEPRRAAVRTARAFAPGAWRGGIGGIGGVDAALAPDTMAAVAAERGLDAVVPVGVDWRWIDPDLGVDRVVERFRQDPDAHPFVFTTLPPGLASAVIRTEQLRDFAGSGRLGTLASRLVHQPMRSAADPIIGPACIPVAAELRRHVSVIDADHPPAMAPAGPARPLAPHAGAADVLDAIERSVTSAAAPRPRHLILRTASTTISADDVVARLADFGRLDGTAVSLEGPRDPLHWDGWSRVAGAARGLGAAAVHLRTTLRPNADGRFAGSGDVVADLTGGLVDVLSVDLHAADAEGYRAVHGVDAYESVTRRIQAVVDARPCPRTAAGLLALTRPWIVPRLARHGLTIDAIATFHEHWQHCLGTAHVECALPDWIRPATDGRAVLELIEPPEVTARRRDETFVLDLGRSAMPPDLLDAWADTARAIGAESPAGASDGRTGTDSFVDPVVDPVVDPAAGPVAVLGPAAGPIGHAS